MSTDSGQFSSISEVEEEDDDDSINGSFFQFLQHEGSATSSPLYSSKSKGSSKSWGDAEDDLSARITLHTYPRRNSKESIHEDQDKLSGSLLIDSNPISSTPDPTLKDQNPLPLSLESEVVNSITESSQKSQIGEITKQDEDLKLIAPEVRLVEQFVVVSLSKKQLEQAQLTLDIVRLCLWNCFFRLLYFKIVSCLELNLFRTLFP